MRAPNLVIDRANAILAEWEKADGQKRRAMVADYKSIPKSYIALTSPTTGYPVVGLFPFGHYSYPIEVALEAGRAVGLDGTVVMYRGRYHPSVEAALATNSDL